MIGFNKDINKINELIEDKAQKIDFEDNTSAINIDSDSNYESEGIDSEQDEIDSISKINKAFKTIEILGYIIKNRYASLPGIEKTELVEELYKLGLRSLSFLFNTLMEGEDYIKNEIIDLIKKDPNSALTLREREDMAKHLMFNLLYMVSYSIFKRISSSISSKDLEKTFSSVQNKLALAENGEENNAISLINMAVIFEYSKAFPEKDVKELSENFKNNPLAFQILRRLGVNFMRMIPMRENEQQKASSILDIPIKNQRLLTATSAIKK